MTGEPEMTEETAVSGPMTPEECIDRLQTLRRDVMPLLKAAKEQYTGRVRNGYPTLLDNVDRGGIFGINLDPGFGLYFMTDGAEVYAEIHRVHLRTDTLSAANYEKFAGRPQQERYEIDFDRNTVRQARNLLSHLLNYWTTQQTFVYRVDS
ncbi:MAG: hypothetical protein ACOC9Y_05160 [Chloroflexota bacterium]